MMPTGLGVAAARPTPCNALKTSNDTSSGENGATRHERLMQATPSWKMTRRPQMSAMRPQRSSVQA